MFVSLKGRTCNIGQYVKVYKNLNNGYWSIKDAKSNLVLGYSECVTIENVKFTLSEKSRQRVLKEKTRNVHAYAVGYITAFEYEEMNGAHVIYNPYKDEFFTTVESERKENVKQANKVTMQSSTNIVIASM